jgi:hypothetical protein
LFIRVAPSVAPNPSWAAGTANGFKTRCGQPSGSLLAWADAGLPVIPEDCHPAHIPRGSCRARVGELTVRLEASPEPYRGRPSLVWRDADPSGFVVLSGALDRTSPNLLDVAVREYLVARTNHADKTCWRNLYGEPPEFRWPPDGKGIWASDLHIADLDLTYGDGHAPRVEHLDHIDQAPSSPLDAFSVNHDFEYDGDLRSRTMPDPPGEEEATDSDAQPRDPECAGHDVHIRRSGR